MKTIEEQYLLNKIEEANKKKIEYLEADRNKEASKWEDKELLLTCIYLLVEDGYKYRKNKVKEFETKVTYGTGISTPKGLCDDLLRGDKNAKIS